MLYQMFAYMLGCDRNTHIETIIRFTLDTYKQPTNLRQYYADKLLLMYYEVANGN